jgi:hypothetical protein
VILIAITLAAILVTLPFIDQQRRKALTESEWDYMRTYMTTLQNAVDDVAWMQGATRSLQFSLSNGFMFAEPDALNYSVLVDKGSGYVPLVGNITTGVLGYKTLIHDYSLGGDYHEAIRPNEQTFWHTGGTNLFTYLFGVEKIPMADGNYLRLVLAPTVTVLNFEVAGEQRYRVLIVKLSGTGTQAGRNGVTVAGVSYEIVGTADNVIALKVTVGFPQTGYDNTFFNFKQTSTVIDVPAGSTVEVVTCEVTYNFD